MTTRRNMALGEKLYHAKVLLFGEYGIIKDAMGLSKLIRNLKFWR